MSRRTRGREVGILLLCLGVFGVSLAITGLLIGLPNPAVGGTCGPGRGSEAAIVAIFDPVTIGAGPEPPVTAAGERAHWSAFVRECQTAADDRAYTVFPVLLVSLGLVVAGLVMARRRSRRPAASGLTDTRPPWSTGPAWQSSEGPVPSAVQPPQPWTTPPLPRDQPPFPPFAGHGD